MQDAFILAGAVRPRVPLGIYRGLRGDLSHQTCLLAPGILGKEVREEGKGLEKMSLSGTRGTCWKTGGQSLLCKGKVKGNRPETPNRVWALDTICVPLKSCAIILLTFAVRAVGL